MDDITETLRRYDEARIAFVQFRREAWELMRKADEARDEMYRLAPAVIQAGYQVNLPAQ